MKMRKRNAKPRRKLEQACRHICPACDYSLEFVGPPDDLAAVQAFLDLGVRVTRGYCPGNIMLDLTRLFDVIRFGQYSDRMIGIATEQFRSSGVGNIWGAAESYSAGVGSSGVFEWFKAERPMPTNDEQFQGGTWECNIFQWSSDRTRMRISGRSWMGPPVRLAARLTQRHPSVRLGLSGVSFDLFERPRSEERLADLAQIDAELAAIARSGTNPHPPALAGEKFFFNNGAST
jgi:hypothetical protein